MYVYLSTQWRRLFGLNASVIEPNLLVGGQFRPEQWPELRALGVRAVLSLQAEHEDRFAGGAPDRALRLAVQDFTPPSLEQLADGIAFISAAHQAGLTVFVHCHAGVGRAPLMAAAYLMYRQELDHRTALARIRAARPIIGLNAPQIKRLRELEAILQAGIRGDQSTDRNA
ncbi:MAG: dual specificity protein phosphatase family protein [Chloroflexaceae bacterium]|nr:dual specificity protein phosphatase family protein [Chloroflexaceae bacterium]